MYKKLISASLMLVSTMLSTNAFALEQSTISEPTYNIKIYRIPSERIGAREIKEYNNNSPELVFSQKPIIDINNAKLDSSGKITLKAIKYNPYVTSITVITEKDGHKTKKVGNDTFKSGFTLELTKNKLFVNPPYRIKINEINFEKTQIFKGSNVKVFLPQLSNFIIDNNATIDVGKTLEITSPTYHNDSIQYKTIYLISKN